MKGGGGVSNGKQHKTHSRRGGSLQNERKKVIEEQGGLPNMKGRSTLIAQKN